MFHRPSKKLCGIGLLAAGLSLLPNLGAQAQQAAGRHSLGIAMVTVPAGSFQMGSCLVRPERDVFLGRACDNPDHDAKMNETPQRTVAVSSFQIAKTEVTLRQFKQFIVATGRESLVDAQFMQHNNQGDSAPVVRVSWSDAQDFVRWLNQVDGPGWRLPTEAEWEYAARAGSRSRYPAGDHPDVLLKSANTFDRESALRWPRWREQAGHGSDGYPFTAPVGSFQPNAFGLYDMIGNVWEWVADWYGEDYYARAPLADPQGPAEGTVRVRRGGSWHSWPLYSRVAFRNWNTPETRYVLVGFRLLREAPPAAHR